jgi:hypothetical protein
MKFSTTVASSLLLASSAIASPLAARVAAREARRGGRLIESIGNVTAEPGQVNAVQQSTNWAGAVLTSSGYTGVTGTFTVPTPKLPSGAQSGTQYCTTAWVGIDGDNSCSNVIA